MEERISIGDGFYQTFEDLYEIEDSISKGPIWDVYRCKAKWSEHRFVVKIIEKQEDERPVQLKYDIEIGPLVILRHSNLLKIKETFETSLSICLVVQLAGGGELFQHLAARESYSEHDISKCIQQIVSALRYLHQNQVSHGSLKPENVLCEVKGDQIKVLIGDYGMECIIDYRVLLLNSVWGSAGFISPETLKGKNSEKPADMWSVGVIVYILLSGSEPFYSDIEAEKFKLIMKCQFGFEAVDWQEISGNAKEFIQGLLVASAQGRLTAAEASRHAWLTGTVRRQQLQNTPHKLSQLINARKLKMSTEVAKSFTSRDLADTFPHQLASLDHLRELLTTDEDLEASGRDQPDVEVAQEATPPADAAATGEDEETAGLALQLDIPFSDYTIQYCGMIQMPGIVFGDPLPWTLPSSEAIYLSGEDLLGPSSNSESYLPGIPLQQQFLDYSTLDVQIQDWGLELPNDDIVIDETLQFVFLI